MAELKLMRVGTNMEEATLVTWLKKPGEAFSDGEPLYQIETDKVTYDVEAPYPGELVEIKVNAGDVVPVGAVVAIVKERKGS